MIKVGLIGCGKIGQVRHLPEYAANKDCVITALYDINLERAQALAKQYGATAYESVEALLASDVEAVSVCSSNTSHAEITIAALKAGKHVLCEKPMANDERECDEMIAACEAELRDRLEPHRDAVALLCTIPGVSELSAMLILSETGTDMSVFEDAAHFASWAGLAPGCDESAGKRRSSRTTRAGQYLKPVLVQCALASTTAKAAAGDYFAAKYRRLRARRGHKRAVVAVARMMAVCIWHMLSTGEVFNPSDLDAPDRRRERRALTEQSALELLRGMGYDITAPEPAE